MKGIRFYADYGSAKAKRKGGLAPNAIALNLEDKARPGIIEGLAAVFDSPNSGVATTGIGYIYLRESCKRISEATARKIHPELFKALKRSDS